MEKINRLKKKISGKGRRGVYLGRLLPYVRGYVSVAAGLIKIPPKEFLPAVFLSAITWSGGYALLGMLLGPSWESLIARFGLGTFFAAIVSVGLIVYFAWSKTSAMIKKRKEKIML